MERQNRFVLFKMAHARSGAHFCRVGFYHVPSGIRHLQGFCLLPILEIVRYLLDMGGLDVVSLPSP
jgi:hypothetical protein